MTPSTAALSRLRLFVACGALVGCAVEDTVPSPDDVPDASTDVVVLAPDRPDAVALLDVALLDAPRLDAPAPMDVARDLGAPDVPAPVCLHATQPCTGTDCCTGLSCGTTTLGRVCCGNAGASCATVNGEDCCGDLECIAGHCAAAPTCLGAVRPCSANGDCCAGLSCGTTTAGHVCCGNTGATCATANGEDCCGDLECVSGHCAAPACAPAVHACSSNGDCCAGLTCGNTTAGHVCCGNAGATCATANGEDCCGSLECVAGRCVGGSTCIASRGACSGSGCCAGLTCGTTTLGRVCCGNAGAACVTANGEDCCGSLECISGHCGTATSGGSCGPSLTYYPVRALHNNGYDPTAGDSSQWTCDSAHSNSDFVGGGRHLGNDIWAARGSPVIATVSGTLRYVAYSSYSGNQVTIVDDCGWYHFYCHMNGFAAGIGPSANGTRVTAGRLIGYVGNTGTASNGVIHLHYSIYPSDNYDAGIDPYPYLHAVESNVCHLP